MRAFLDRVFGMLPLLAIAAAGVSGGQAEAAAPGIEEARQLIQALPEPALPGVSYREFSIQASIVGHERGKRDQAIVQAEKDFWSQTLYAANGEPASFEFVQSAAQGNSISAFRARNRLAVDFFLSRFACASAGERLAELLPAWGSLATGYLDEESDAFGEQVFVFPFESALLVVTIHHAHN